MRSTLLILTVLVLAMPRLASAQNSLDDDNGPPPYNDVDDGQLLRIAGYVLAPFGYALEWGVTRPLHYAATDTALAPVLSGDTNIRYFGESANADRLPASTFAPFRMPANPNAIDPKGNLPPTFRSADVIPPPTVQSYQSRSPSSPGGQSAMH